MITMLNSTAVRRTTRVRWAIYTSLGSKVMTAALQVLVVPLAVRVLGPERFGVYVMLAAALNWIWSAGVGIGPSLTIAIARASAVEDRECETRYFTAAITTMAAIGLLILITTTTALQWYGLDAILGPQYASYRADIEPGIAVMIVGLVSVLLTGVVEGAQAGYQEQYIINFAGMMGSGLGALSLLLVILYRPSIINMIVCLYGIMYLPKLVNAVLMVRSRSYLVRSLWYFDINIVRSLLGTGTAFSFVQVGQFLKQECSVLLVGRLLGPGPVASYAIIINITLLAFGVVTMQLQPLIPAITDALAVDDLAWIRRACRRTRALCMVYAVGVGMGFMTAGGYVIRHWYGPQVVPTLNLQIAIGVAFILQVWEVYHLTVLLSLRRIWLAVGAFLVQNTLVLMLCPVAIHRFGAVGAVYALCTMILLIDAWLLPYMVRSQLQTATVRYTNCATELVVIN